MIVLSYLKKLFHSEYFYLMLLSFLGWLFCFKDFLSGAIPLTADALSYFDHIGFYTDQLSKGVYPLWNPLWFDGAPYHFFLRRIGDGNPLFLIIIFLKWIGIGQTYAYMIFLTIYYFLTTTAFYLIARCILKDRLFAFMAFVLLLFSSWGVQLFYNYIILIFLPIIWFFYFLLCFLKESRKSYFLGMCFCLGMVLTTYIPFYFLIILITFTVCSLLIYFQELVMFLKRSVSFIKENKLFVCFCVLFLLIALLPGIVFYFESKTGDFLLPHRNADALEARSAVAVGISNVSSGDIINNGAFDKVFEGNTSISMGDFYIPYLFFILLLCGVLGQSSKLILFLFLNTTMVLSIAVTNILPVHKFLYDHLFFFKFIRNIYYFFWLFVLPMGILFVTASLQSFVRMLANASFREKVASFCYISFCHLAFLVFLFSKDSLSLGAALSVCLSFTFFLLFVWVRNVPQFLFAFLIAASVFIQSIEVYGYLNKNCDHDPVFINRRIPNLANYVYKLHANNESAPLKVSTTEEAIKNLKSNIYYSTNWYALLYKYIDADVLQAYDANKFIFYDNVVSYSDEKKVFALLQESMMHKSNLAFVFKGNDQQPPDLPMMTATADHPEMIEGASDKLKVTYFDANTIVMDMNLDKKQFLVINDSYATGWQVFVNNQKAFLYRANAAFKGLWVPSGKSHVVLRFLTPWHYVWHIGIILFFMAAFIYLLYLLINERIKATSSILDAEYV